MVSTWRQASIIGRSVGLALGSRRPLVAAGAFLLLALAALGCSASPDDEPSPAIAEQSRTTEAVLPTTTVQPFSPSTTAQPDQPEPPPTTTTTAEPEPSPTTIEPGTQSEDETDTEEPSLPQDEGAAPADTGVEPGDVTVTEEPSTPQDEEAAPADTGDEPGDVTVTEEPSTPQDEEAAPADTGVEPGDVTVTEEPSTPQDEEAAPADTGVEPGDVTVTEEPSTPQDEEAAPDDTGDEPESDGSPESAPAESQDVFEPVSLAVSPELVHQRLLRWSDGFLHLGYLPSGMSEELGQPCGVEQLRTRFSTDGMQWNEFSDLELPSIHTKPTLLSQLGLADSDYIECWVNEYRTPRHFSSDGENFVIASQWPTYLDTWFGRSADDAAWLDQLLENSPSIALSITRDLVNWETIEVPIPRPDGLHASLQTAPTLVGLSLADHGWLVALETVTYMNLFSLMPADIREEANRIEPKYNGPWHDESTGESGMTVEWWTDEISSGDPNTRFVSWDELGTIEELYDDYGAILNKPYHPPWRYSGSIFTASWGESPRQFDLPDIYKCCDTILTDSGYVGLSNPEIAGYNPSWWGPGELVFSADGRDWSRIVTPSPGDHWESSISAVDGGLILSSIEPDADEEDSLAGTRRYWIGAADGSDWQPIELPEGMSLIEWLMAHDRAPIDWPHIAVNGNIVLRTSHDGRIDRYVAPE